MKFVTPSMVILSRLSLPARGAWVEISAEMTTEVDTIVAPREGSVG